MMFSLDRSRAGQLPVCVLGACLAGVCALASGCDAFHGNAESPGAPTGLDGGARVVGPQRDAGSLSGGRAGASAGAAGGFAGVGGMGFPGTAGFTGGMGGFPGFAGGFPMGVGGVGACFECAPGCVDCSNGLGCSCAFDPTHAPPWSPPFDDVGEAGWLDSSQAFCAGLQQVYTLDLWSNSAGVYALVSGLGQATGPNVTDDDAGVATPAAPGLGVFASGGMGGGSGMAPGDFAIRTRLWHNDGSGWAVRVDGLGGAMLMGLAGIATDRLVVSANPLPEELTCRLGMTTRGGFRCWDVDPIQDVAAVNGSLAYALMGGTRLLQFDGTEWRGNPVLLPYAATHLWADESDVVAIGNAGTVLRLRGDHWELEDPGVLEGLTAIWGTSANDLWVGTSSGKLLRYDGASWTQRAQIGGQTCNAHQPVTGIWGSGDVIFAHTTNAVVRFKDGVLEQLGNWTCNLITTQQVRALWGTSADDVFVALVDQSGMGTECGTAYIAHFDGTEFHRM